MELKDKQEDHHIQRLENGGKGGYSSGVIELKEGTNLYIYVGSIYGYNGGGTSGFGGNRSEAHQM